jgi:cell division protease FtsH
VCYAALTVGRLRPPQPTFDRVKRSIFLVGLAFALEYVDPLPFMKSWGARFIWFMLVFEIGKQLWIYRLETSNAAMQRTLAYRAQWEGQKSRFEPNVRYRIRRFLISVAGLWVYGQVISLFTDRCEGGFGCALMSITLVTEQMPTILQMFLGIAFSMVNLAVMYYAVASIGTFSVVLPGTITTTFDDIFGQDRARDRIKEQVELLENDEAVIAAGGYMPKGVLLTGPPGTGKTMLAKAAANASTKPLILIPPGGLTGMFVASNIMKIKKLGRAIRKFSKRHGGVIVFFDEIDSLGNRGNVDGVEPWETMHGEDWIPHCGYSEPDYPVIITGGSGGGQPGTLEAFLAMMDGMEEPRGLVNKLLSIAGFKPLPPPAVRPFYLGATNRPKTVDEALKRAGRFGSEVRVDFPKFDGRIATYNGYLGKLKSDLSEEQVEWMARNHYRGTGAEIQDIVNEALLISFRHNSKAVNNQKGVVTFDNATNAMLRKRFGESNGVPENPDNIMGVAVHEAGHALVMHKLLKDRVHIWFVSIEARGRTGGMVTRSPLDDDWQQMRNEMLADCAISLASRAAEHIVLGQPSNGHGGDGPNATRVAEKMLLLGHGNQIGFAKDREPELFFQEREEILGEALFLAHSILVEHEDALMTLAHALIQKPTMRGDDVHALLEANGV